MGIWCYRGGMTDRSKSYRALEIEAVDRFTSYSELLGESVCEVPNKAKFARALQERGREGRRELADFERWLVEDLGLASSTAKRKRRLVWGAFCDYPGEIWKKVTEGHLCQGCYGVFSWNYREDIRRAIRDFCEWILDDDDFEEEHEESAEICLARLGYDPEDTRNKIALRRATRKRGRTR